MALAAWALGGLLLLAGGIRDPVARMVARAGDALGPRRWYGAALAAANSLSDRLHALEVHDLRTSLAAVLLPSGILMALAFTLTPTEGAYDVGPIAVADIPIVVFLGLAVAAAITAARDRGRLRPVLALSVLGFGLAAVYAMVGAPDVALVAVVVETMLTIIFVGAFAGLPPPDPATLPAVPGRRFRNAIAGVIAGASAFAVIWAALSRVPTARGDAAAQIERVADAHGGDVVTVILADFRGLDTMVEITVLTVAIFGVATLLRRGSPGNR